MSAALILAGAVLCAVSGAPALLPRRWRGSTSLAAPLLIAGAALGLAGAALGLTGRTGDLVIPWTIPGGALLLRADALSAFFAAPVFLIGAAGGVYAEGYWPADRPRASWVRLFYGVVVGALALVMIADHTMLFLALWEIVTVAAFFLVATDAADDAHARSAAWLYLLLSHVAALCLFAVFGLLHASTGGWGFTTLPAGTEATAAGRAIFWLALAGFGLKAGLMPLHVWLPGAHAAAPSHVSALMSGVVIKMGIYGLVRTLSLFTAPPAWFGGTLLAFGLVSSVLGVVFALAQHDLKRLLAYHSIENIGIIVTGLGAGLLALSHGQREIAFLALAGGLLHVWNHSLFKSLLFLAAGAVIHGVHTRQIDRMGGLAKRQRGAAAGFLVGAAAICGLPPLNGFVSEWLITLASFLGIQQAAPTLPIALGVVAPALALTGALALACFVKAFGAVFLGEPRTREAAEAEESPRSMRAALLPAAIACAAIGLAPALLAPTLARVVAVASGVAGDLSRALTPLQALAPLVALVGAGVFLALRRRVASSPRVPTWDCGYAAPSARMQYSASSFARTLVDFFAWVLRPAVHTPRLQGLFPARARHQTHVGDVVLDGALLPAAQAGKKVMSLARFTQRGRIQVYLLYVGLTLISLLVWSSR